MNVGRCFLVQHALVTLEQRCQTKGPGAKSGPRLHLMWPARAWKEYNTFTCHFTELPINYMSHNASHFLNMRTEETCNYLPYRLLLSDVVNYEVITLSDNNPMQSQQCKIIHYFIYIMYLYMYIYIVLKLQPTL